MFSTEFFQHVQVWPTLLYLLSVSINVDRPSRVVKGLMGILHNTLHRVNESWLPMRDANAVNIIQKFRDCYDKMVACKALILQVCTM